MHRRAILKAFAACAAPAILGRPAFAETWPSRPITLVVPYGAGGTIDATARLYAEHASGTLGQRVVVENKPGAQGNVGGEAVARSAPDGYTLLLASAGLANNPAFGPKPKFDAARAFQPVGLLASAANILLARPGIGVATVADMVRVTKAKPNEITLGAGQIDTYVELLKRRSGAQYRLVPYRTSPQALTDAVAGHIDLAMALVPTALPLVNDKALVAVAVSSSRRSSVLPDVPTYTEVGIPDAEVESWFGISLPAGSPADVAQRLVASVRDFIRDPATKERMTVLGIEIAAEGTPESFAELVGADSARWLRIAKEFDAAQ